MERYTISVRQAQKALSLGRTKVYDLMAQGRLERIKVGRRTLITTASIKALVGGG